MGYEAPSSLSFAAALQTRLEALPTVAAYIAKAVPEKPPTGYVVCDVAGTAEYAGRMTGLASEGGGGFVARCCGYSIEQALRTADLVAAALVNWRWSDDPSVSPLRRTSTSDVIKDASVPTDTRWSVSLHYRYDA